MLAHNRTHRSYPTHERPQKGVNGHLWCFLPLGCNCSRGGNQTCTSEFEDAETKPKLEMCTAGDLLRVSLQIGNTAGMHADRDRLDEWITSK